MAKTKRPPLEMEDVTETLKESKGQGMDVFFPTPPSEDNDNSQTINDTGITHTLTEKPDKEISAETKDLNEKVKKRNERKKDVRDDVMTSSLHDVNLREWRDTVENTETHNSSLRLTTEESDEIEDLIKELKRRLKIKTSLNEVARLGLLYILHDFKKNRENSLIYKVKKS
jgi:hypothetical protein